MGATPYKGTLDVIGRSRWAAVDGSGDVFLEDRRVIPRRNMLS